MENGDRKRYTGEEKLAVLKRHIADGEAVSEVYTQTGVSANRFYRWRHELLEHGVVVFNRSERCAGGRRVKELEDVVAVSPATVYRVLRSAGLLSYRRWKRSKKGIGFVQPLQPHDHWHTDITFIIGHVSPQAMLEGRREEIQRQRDRKLEEA